MTIHKNGTQISDVYPGSTIVNKVYHGSQLVFSSSLPVWRYVYSYNGYTQYAYIVGSQDLNGLVLTTNSTSINTQITAISGTLGVSGSKVTSQSIEFIYYATQTIKGKVVYQYLADMVYGYYRISVLDGSVVGSIGLLDSFVRYPSYLSSISNSSCVINFYTSTATWHSATATIDSSYLKYWTKDSLT